MTSEYSEQIPSPEQKEKQSFSEVSDKYLNGLRGLRLNPRAFLQGLDPDYSFLRNLAFLDAERMKTPQAFFETKVPAMWKNEKTDEEGMVDYSDWHFNLEYLRDWVEQAFSEYNPNTQDAVAEMLEALAWLKLIQQDGYDELIATAGERLRVFFTRQYAEFKRDRLAYFDGIKKLEEANQRNAPEEEIEKIKRSIYLYNLPAGLFDMLIIDRDFVKSIVDEEFYEELTSKLNMLRQGPVARGLGYPAPPKEGNFYSFYHDTREKLEITSLLALTDEERALRNIQTKDWDDFMRFFNDKEFYRYRSGLDEVSTAKKSASLLARMKIVKPLFEQKFQKSL